MRTLFKHDAMWPRGWDLLTGVWGGVSRSNVWTRSVTRNQETIRNFNWLILYVSFEESKEIFYLKLLNNDIEIMFFFWHLTWVSIVINLWPRLNYHVEIAVWLYHLVCITLNKQLIRFEIVSLSKAAINKHSLNNVLLYRFIIFLFQMHCLLRIVNMLI